MTHEEVLKNCRVEGLVVKLPDVQLPRETYLSVKKSLELIGGAWKGGKVAGFVFKLDPTKLLESIQGGEKRNLKKEVQFFATPQKVAEQMVRTLAYPRNAKVLEPSAGQGAIIKEMNELGVVPDCFEILDVNREVLLQSDLEFKLIGEDFLEFDGENIYDCIVANPPFSKGQDMTHIEKMLRVLKPGGALVTVVSESTMLSTNKRAVNFKAMLDKYKFSEYALERGTFAESGTQVPARVLMLVKPQ